MYVAAEEISVSATVPAVLNSQGPDVTWSISTRRPISSRRSTNCHTEPWWREGLLGTVDLELHIFPGGLLVCRPTDLLVPGCRTGLLLPRWRGGLPLCDPYLKFWISFAAHIWDMISGAAGAAYQIQQEAALLKIYTYFMLWEYQGAVENKRNFKFE